MKLLKNLLLLCSLALLAFSCNNDDDQHQPAPVTFPNYSQLKVGNYWIYQRFQIDNGTVTPLNIYDSVYVEKDSVMNGNRYYYLNKPDDFTPYKSVISGWLRDSLHYTLSGLGAGGDVVFSSQDFTTQFLDYYVESSNDTLYRRVNQMVEKDMLINTPAGNFETSNYREEYRFYPAYNSNVPAAYMNHQFAKNVGLVNETLLGYLFDFQNGRWKERRLVRYHLH